MAGSIQISDVWWFDKVVTGMRAVVDHRQLRLPGMLSKQMFGYHQRPVFLPGKSCGQRSPAGCSP